nr:hypothetical protein [Tanacetum cinerariifolium]
MTLGYISTVIFRGCEFLDGFEFDNVNVETLLESNKGDVVNSNANVKPTTSASLLAFVLFATLLKGYTSQKSVNFRTLITSAGNGADVVIPLESIRVFSSKDGLDAMLENGPWFILNNTLILKKWDSDVNLLKEDVGNVLVWVKLHSIRMMAFSEDGLSAIATKLDQHAYTLCHLESRLTISHDNLCLDNLDIFKEDVNYQSSKSLYLELS